MKQVTSADLAAGQSRHFNDISAPNRSILKFQK